MGARTDSGWGEVAARDDADVGVDAGLVAPVCCAPTWARRATDNRFTCRRLANRALGRIKCAVGQHCWIGQHFTTTGYCQLCGSKQRPPERQPADHPHLSKSKASNVGTILLKCQLGMRRGTLSEAAYRGGPK